MRPVMKVKVLDTTDAYVSYKYLNSNSKSRAFKDAFMRDYKSGLLTVVNPSKLED